MKSIYILALVLFGFLLMPNSTFACKSHLEKTACHKETSSSSDKMECCKKNSQSKKMNCNGKCGHTNCVTTTASQFSAVFLEIEFRKNNNIDFFEKKQSFFYSQNKISTGFTSIWLIPKIG
ncbi:hypothetical protein [Flavobacterium crassostreae]|uniref:Uncharacterized protein n=1 Tax=Flavobacterium crassostreae TaxID=1763534 RepID=A0A1B9DML9_9FLAO|nr:hypothetical protein [Flavobacterium crassostreae]OCB70936.1 hypothetical protein LPBF_11775 [Flavobacterium crassostreae]